MHLKGEVDYVIGTRGAVDPVLEISQPGAYANIGSRRGLVLAQYCLVVRVS